MVLNDDGEWKGVRLRVILNMDDGGFSEMTDERDWGFITLLDETPVLNFFATGSVMNATLRILLSSSPINTDLSRRCGKIDNIIFLCSNGFVLSSSSESNCA
jgi:hypothetical protein